MWMGVDAAGDEVLSGRRSGIWDGIGNGAARGEWMKAGAARIWKGVGGHWIAAWAMVVLYVAAYATMIRADTAIPYFDQSGYVTKTYRLVETWNQAGAIRAGQPWWRRAAGRLWPGQYLAAAPPLRPPLLEVVPAVIWRHRATAHEMAITWLLFRAFLLLAGIWGMARIVADARWVPLAVAVTLGSQFFLQLNQNLYLMDVPFAAGGLLAVALVVRAIYRRTAVAALLAGAGTIALLLIKPQALAFMFPFFVFLVLERGVHFWRTPRIAGWKRPLLDLLGWGAALLLLLGVIVELLRSPYGLAAADQYTLNTQGFWQHSVDARSLWALLAGIAPPWLIALAIVALVAAKKNPAARRSLPLPLLACVALGFAWWIAFNLFLTFDIDPRLMWSIAPAAVCVVSILVWQAPWIGKIATIVAALWMLLAFAVTVGALPLRTLPSPGLVMGPVIARQEIPQDVGLRPFVEETARAIGDGKAAHVEVMACDDFVQANAFNLAARWTNHDLWSPVRYQAAPWGDDGFDVRDLFVGPQSGWYATKTVRPTTALSKAAFVNLLAIRSLIVEEASPIHQLFEVKVRQPLAQPVPAETGLLPDGTPAVVLHDEMVLWHLPRPLTPAECTAAVSFVLPQYEGTTGLERMKGELALLERAAVKGTGAALRQR